MSLLTESRYDRQERISWWDQKRLAQSRVLVVGAGALGNELVKNLVLLGVGDIHVVDMDVIEHTNLARCVFFRAGDEGKPKSEVLAAAAQAANSDVMVTGHVGPVQSLGSGFLAEFNIVLGGLDNREARLWVNRSCRRLGIHWIDGAIEGLHGVVQHFAPEGACYECTLTEVDWKILSHRRSCALLGTEEMLSGKTPTNATTASLVAAIQVQEAIKYLVGREDLLALVGRQWSLIGEPMAAFTSVIDEDTFCMAHEEPMEPVADVKDAVSLRELLTRFGSEESVLDLADDFLSVAPCASCATGGAVGLRALMTSGQGSCPTCGSTLNAETRTSLSASDAAMDVPLSDVLWPRCELVYVRTGDQRTPIRVWRS